MPKVLNKERKLPRPDDPELLENICASQRSGRSVRVTASNATMAKTTLVDWLRLGREQLAAYDAGLADELGSLGVFASRYEEAAAEFESSNTDDIIASIHDSKVNFVPALILNKARNPADWLEARQVNIASHSTVLTVSVALPSLAQHELLELVRSSLESKPKLLGAAEIEAHGVEQDS